MANKKITELVQATSIVNTDLLLLETANGTRSIAYQDLKKPIDDAVTDAAKPHPFANNAAAHNGIFRGKDLTAIYTIDQIVLLKICILVIILMLQLLHHILQMRK